MKKRSIFAAVAMLIVSAIVLTSATYAWFTVGGDGAISAIEANTMTVTSGVMLKSQGSDAQWKGTLANADFTTTGLKGAADHISTQYQPVTSATGVDMAAYKLDGSLHFVKENSVDTAWYTEYTFNVGVITAGQKITATPTISGTGAGAARVALLQQSGNTWSPLALWSNNASEDTNAIAATATVPNTIVDDGNYILTSADGTLADGTLVAQTPVKASGTGYDMGTFAKAYNDSTATHAVYKVVIWCEGNDSACTPDQMSAKAISVEWAFAASNPT
jgi:hypothetical protein